MILANKLKGASINGEVESTLLGVRYADSVTFYSTDDWSVINTFTTLSCGTVDSSPPSKLSISPDGSFFLTGGISGAGAYSMTDGSQLYFLGAGRSQSDISHDGGYIAVIHDVGTTSNCLVIETSTWTTFKTLVSVNGSNDEIRIALAWSNDDTKIAFGGDLGYVRIWDVSTATAWSNQLDILDNIHSLEFSPDDTLLAVTTMDIDNTTTTIEAINVGTTIARASAFGIDYGRPFGASFTPDGAYLITGIGSTTNALRMYDTATWTEQATATTNYNHNILAISKLGNFVANVGGYASPYLEIRNTSDLTLIADTTPTVGGACYAVAWN